nr:hypothetical protein [Candidatus Saccharibacteria bacterium]
MKPLMVRLIKYRFRNYQQGSAALIITIAISAVLVVLFVGVTSVVTREISKSINSDNASRALYAAEAGVEDAIQKIQTDSTFTENTCNLSNGGAEVPVDTAPAASGESTAWTCRTVKQYDTVLEGKLAKDQSLILNLAKARQKGTTTLKGVAFMKMSWNNPDEDSRTPLGTATALRSNGAGFLPYYTDAVNNGWEQGAAVMEISSTWFRYVLDSGTFNADSSSGVTTRAYGGVLPARTILASPACNTNIVAPASCPNNDFSPWRNINPSFYISPFSVAYLNSAGNSTCSTNTSAAYNCIFPISGNYDIRNLMKTEIDRVDANSTGGRYALPTCTETDYSLASNPATPSCALFLKIRPRYSGTSYKLEFFDSTGAALEVPDGFATIDVTARSSNYYRRVVAKKKLAPTVYDGIFDNAIFSGKNICKNMQIYKDFRGFPDK